MGEGRGAGWGASEGEVRLGCMWAYCPVGVTHAPSPRSPGLGTRDGSEIALVSFGWFHVQATIPLEAPATHQALFRHWGYSDGDRETVPPSGSSQPRREGRHVNTLLRCRMVSAQRVWEEPR